MVNDKMYASNFLEKKLDDAKKKFYQIQRNKRVDVYREIVHRNSYKERKMPDGQ